MTDQNAGDASQVEPLLDQIDMPIAQFTADGTYDGSPTDEAVTRQDPEAALAIPPRACALERPDSGCSRRWFPSGNQMDLSLAPDAIGPGHFSAHC